MSDEDRSQALADVGEDLDLLLRRPAVAIGNRGLDLEHAGRRAGARIRHRRIALGISSHQFAKRLGITHQEADQYEVGIRRIGSQRLFHIARALEVDIDFFFCPHVPISGLPPMEP